MMSLPMNTLFYVSFEVSDVPLLACQIFTKNHADVNYTTQFCNENDAENGFCYSKRVSYITHNDPTRN